MDQNRRLCFESCSYSCDWYVVMLHIHCTKHRNRDRMHPLFLRGHWAVRHCSHCNLLHSHMKKQNKSPSDLKHCLFSPLHCSPMFGPLSLDQPCRRREEFWRTTWLEGWFCDLSLPQSSLTGTPRDSGRHWSSGIATYVVLNQRGGSSSLHASKGKTNMARRLWRFLVQ